MIIIEILVFAAGLLGLYWMWKSRRQENGGQEKEWNGQTDEPTRKQVAAPEEMAAGMSGKTATPERKALGTREFFLQTLTKIGCQYELAEEENDKRIFFAFQGERFFADTNDESRYVQLYDAYWEHVELYDIEEFSRLKKAINNSNLNNSVTAVYTIDEAGGTVDVHCKSIILFVPQIPNIEDYLRLELVEFFRVHRHVITTMDRYREIERNGK